MRCDKKGLARARARAVDRISRAAYAALADVRVCARVRVWARASVRCGKSWLHPTTSFGCVRAHIVRRTRRICTTSLLRVRPPFLSY